MERIGFVGIGNMGRPMTANIVKSRFPLTLYDANAEAARAHAAEIGANAAASLAELGAASDVVVTMLPNGKIVREVMLEADGGLASQLKPGALLIDMSSSDPIGSRDLGPLLAGPGIGFVDAPVSGAVPRARCPSCWAATIRPCRSGPSRCCSRWETASSTRARSAPATP